MQVFDKEDVKGDELVATEYFEWDIVKHFDGKPISKGGTGLLGPHWVPLYGAPMGVEDSKVKKMMNAFPNTASNYRGRVLISMRRQEPEYRMVGKLREPMQPQKVHREQAPAAVQGGGRAARRGHVSRGHVSRSAEGAKRARADRKGTLCAARSSFACFEGAPGDERPAPSQAPFLHDFGDSTGPTVPEEVTYVLRALVVSGVDIPKITRITGTPAFCVTVTVGNTVLRTDFKVRSGKEGGVQWGQLLEAEVTLPADMAQVPDVFLYIEKNASSASKFKFWEGRCHCMPLR